MLKVLLVDDDILVRVGLRMMIDWESLGWEITGEAGNGVQAVEMIEALNPDLLIVDMKMPQMDGTGLLKVIRERKRKTKIVILSCYDDYSYMREALASGANEYMLKPELSKEKLLDVLNSLKREIDEEESQHREWFDLKQQADFHSHHAREMFYRDLLNGKYADLEEVRKACAQYRLDPPDACFGVMIFSTGSRPEEEDDKKREIVENSLFNIIKGLMQTQSKSFLLRDEEGGAYIAIVNRPGADALQEDMKVMAERAVQAASAYMRVNLYVGAGDVARSVADICLESVRARSALRYRLLLPEERVFISSELSSDEGKYSRRDYNEVVRGRCQELFAAMLQQNEERSRKALEDLLAYVLQSGSMRLLSVACNELSGWYNRQLDKLQLDGKDMDGLAYMHVEELLDISDIGSLSRYFLRRVDDLYKAAIPADLTPAIRKAVDYMHARYDQAIGLAEVSAYAGMSKSHFSFLFHEQMGASFIEYLTSLRIEQAQYLLRLGDWKVYEVAAKVGFDNEKYFSQVFRERSGVTPTEYKKSFQ